ncbi:HR [Cervus elaphus hippelaphus]|uniref:HR n=1 Tax=Cervus elaphus hippelaphus TaxID=46360 RepID=A0A212CN51_CEREH|nr:HR [Cervus elaphus hippelaphus]
MRRPESPLTPPSVSSLAQVQGLVSVKLARSLGVLPHFPNKQSWVQRGPSWQGEPGGMANLLMDWAVFQAVKVAVGTLQEAK